MHSPRKVKPFCHLTRKGPLLDKQTSVRSHRNETVSEKNNVISQERDCSLKNKLLCHLIRRDCSLNRQRPQQNCRNRSQNASGSLEPCHNMWHGFATRDSDRRGFCISPSVVKQCFKRIFTHFSHRPGDSTRSVQWVMIQDKPGRVQPKTV